MVKLVGGLQYSYALRGDGQVPVGPVSKQMQLNALEALLATTNPSVLKLPDTLLMLIPLIAGTVYFFKILPKNFLPSEDTGQIMGSTEAAQGISFEDMKRHQQALAAIVNKEPAVDGFMSEKLIAYGRDIDGVQGRRGVLLPVRFRQTSPRKE